MAVHLFSGRILSKSLAASLVVSLAVSFATTEPARAGHVLTHRASTPVAEPAGPIAVSRAATLFKKGAGIDYKNDANIEGLLAKLREKTGRVESAKLPRSPPRGLRPG